jgi:hypothetical protein
LPWLRGTKHAGVSKRLHCLREQYGCAARLCGAVFDVGLRGLAGATGTAKEPASDLYAVADYPAVAMFANRGNGLNCAFEAVEGMPGPGGD